MMVVDSDISGILDRDQRTVRCRQQRQTPSPASNISSSVQLEFSTVCSNECCESSSFRQSPCSSTRKSRTTWRIAQRLKRVLVLSVYLLSIEYLPRSFSAPSHNRNMAERMNQHPKWINPCGSSGQGDMIHDGSDAVVVSDRELLDQIELTANIALNYAKSFRDEYVQKTYNNNFTKFHQLWKAHDYSWLPSRDQIPKGLEEPTPSKHLESLELDKALLDTYQYLQTVAVGLEQLVWDQADEEGAFLNQFKIAESYLNALLCEIQVALLERRVQQRPDVRRDIMDLDFRNTRNIRDWIIFRDFMNALEYTVDVFTFLKEKL